MKKKLNVWKYYLAAFVIPVVIACVVFAMLGITPFGNHNLLMSDLLTQYMSFFKLLREQLLAHHLSSYSFLISLGDNTVPIFTYYLMSPLNLLVVFVKVVHMPILISVIILIKIGLIGWAMAFFLKMKYHRQDLMQIIAAIAYALSGFVALYFYDFMWLEALMILPLLTLALERLFYKGKWGWYVVALAVIIIINYYMGFMLCVYSVLYFVYLVFLNRPKGCGFFHYLKEHSQMTIKYVASSIIGGLLSCWMLVPTAVGLLTTSKGMFKWTSFLPFPRFGLEFFVNLGVGGNNFNGRLFHNPSIFVGSLFAVGLLLFWLSKRVTKQEKHASWWLVGSIFVGMWINTFYVMWHMFQSPAGFAYRNAYMFGFVMIMLGYEAWIKGAFKNNKQVGIAGGILAVLLIVGYICGNLMHLVFRSIAKADQTQTQFIAGNTHLYYALGFVLATVLVVWGINYFGHKLIYLLLALVSVEMGTNLYLSLGSSGNHVTPFSSQSIFEKNYKHSSHVINKMNKLPQNKKEFGRSRIDNQQYAHSFGSFYNQYNDSMIFDYRGLSGYYSTINMNIHSAFVKLGMSSRNARRASIMGDSPITDNLFGITNHLKINRNGSSAYNYYPENAGIGYAVSPKIKNLKMKKGDVIKNLQMFTDKEAGDNVSYLVPAGVSILKSHPQDYKTLNPYNTTTNMKVDGYAYNLRLKANVTGPQYMYLPKEDMSLGHVFVNGSYQLKDKKIVSKDKDLTGLGGPYSTIGTELISLGRFEKGQVINVKMVVDKKLAPKTLKTNFAGLNLQAFDRFVNETKPYRFKMKHPNKVKLDGSKFSGTVLTSKKRSVVMFSIPFDQGWHVYSHHKELKTFKVAGGMTGIEFKKPGIHHLKFRYKTPGLEIGILLTGLGIIGVLGESLYFKKRKK